MAAFDEASIWDNTPDMPLLYDDYEETDDNTLMFTAVEVDEWPEKGGCVKALERREADEKELAEARSLLAEMQSPPSAGPGRVMLSVTLAELVRVMLRSDSGVSEQIRALVPGQPFELSFGGLPPIMLTYEDILIAKTYLRLP